MKYNLAIILLGLNIIGFGQVKQPESINISYYGEIITHPGIRIGVDYDLKKREKTKDLRSENTKTIQHNLLFRPSIGLFYHTDYQTGLFIIPEIAYKRQNEKGSFIEFGIGAGYLRTFIPNTYIVDKNDAAEKVYPGYNYFASEYFVSFGKDLQIKKNIPLSWYIKPQFMYAMPNFPVGTGYFALELGIRFSKPIFNAGQV